jgi:hypothetical protein
MCEDGIFNIIALMPQDDSDSDDNNNSDTPEPTTSPSVPSAPCEPGVDVRCATETSWSLCSASGKGWVDMGKVPAGMRCEKGTATAAAGLVRLSRRANRRRRHL